jgi:hypothetical protein
MRTTRKRAGVEFDLRYHPVTGEFKGWRGRLVNCEDGERFVDQQDEYNRRAACIIRISPVAGGPADRYELMTQGADKGGRRYRYGTLGEMVDTAERWAARRFYVETV